VILSLLVYTGFGLALVGLVCVIRPLRFLRITTRQRGATLVVAGLLMAISAFAVPAREKRVTSPASRLDEFMPVWQFEEHHATRVRAPVDRAWQAVRGVTAGEIALFRTLTTLRRLGRSGPESILNAPERLPILDVAIRTSFALLAEEPPREIVVGTIVIAPRGFDAGGALGPDVFRSPPAGVALAAMDFQITPDGEYSIVSTRTRVFASDGLARRTFRVYWRLIYPGSSLIRAMWLRAVHRRAEAPV